VDKWTYNLDREVQIDVIYTDFEKAFHKVPHQGLISKLKAYNFNSALLRCIQDFLCNRKQRVVVSENYSDWYRVQSGIPQGSILGPFLCLIYINDLTSVIQDAECRIYLYADNAKIYRNITDVKDVQCLQRVIDKIIKWCDEWLLPLNVDKCKGMTLTSNITKDTSYNVNVKESIHNKQKVDCIKDLGILID